MNQWFINMYLCYIFTYYKNTYIFKLVGVGGDKKTCGERGERERKGEREGGGVMWEREGNCAEEEKI